MADSYNPFFDDDEEQEEDIITDSISTAAETLDNLDEPQEESAEDVPKLKSDLSYDAIATKLIKDRLLLTALELHTELTEAGRQLSPLRDFFSNPGNFEKQAGEVTSSLHRTSSEQTFDSLDLARYSDDGNTQNEEKCTVLEFELRKAKETIKALRASFTEKADKTMRPKRKRVNQDDVAKQFVTLKKDRDGFLIKEIAPKGRGVFTVAPFEKGEFLLQYCGKLCTAEEGDLLEEASSSGFRFFITFEGRDYCIDATDEPSTGPVLGRLVNHGEKHEVNVKLKTLNVGGKPALCLFALRQIGTDEELLYNYGVQNLPWKTSTQTQPGRELCQPQSCLDDFQCNESIGKNDKEKSSGNVPQGPELIKERFDRIDNGSSCADQPIEDNQLLSISATEKVEKSHGSVPHGLEIITERFHAIEIGSSCDPQPTEDEMPSPSDTETVDNFTGNVPEGAEVGEVGENIEDLANGSNFGLQTREEQQSLPDTEIVGISDTESAAGTFSVETGDSDIGETIEYSPESTQDDRESVEYRPDSVEDGTESVGDDQEADRGDSESEVDGSSDSTESYVPESDDEGSELAYSDVIPLPRRSRTSACDVSGVTTKKCESSGESYAGNSKQERKCKSNNLSTKVTVMTTNNTNNRSYDKPAYCYVCSRPQKKLIVHILQHSSEPMVAQWLATEKGPEKDKLWIKIRNFGNHLHNYEVLSQGEGELIVVYRPKTYGDPSDYQPCIDCLGYLSRNEFYRHKCKLRVEEDKEDSQSQQRKQSCVQNSRMLLPPPPGVPAGDVVHKILNTLQADDISRCIKGDSLIVELAKKLCFKHGHDPEQFRTLRTKLREIARLLLEFRQTSGNESATLSDLIVPSKFEDLTTAVRSLTGFDEETHQYLTPSLALKLGHSLKKVAMLVVSKALIEGNDVKERQARDFLTLINENWDWEVSSHALRTLYQGKRNNPKLIPLTSDVILLSKYLKQEAETSLADLKNAQTKEEVKCCWRKLGEVSLTQILLFNRKRQGEISKLTLEDYAKLKKGESHVLDMQILSKFEQNLAKVIWRVEIVGKRGRSVPVLLTQNVKNAVDELLKHRNTVGVEDKNVFVFAIPEGSTHYIRACDTLRKFATECGAKRPDLLRSTQLRKHIATMSQIMALQDNELDVLANFLGHDVRVHREYYRLPDATIQVAKVSKLLIALEGNSGDPSQVLHGKSLEQLDLQENEEVPAEHCEYDEDSEDDFIEGDSETEKERSAENVQGKETATSSPVHVPQQAEGANLEPEEGIKPLEKRALNFLVNEYLLNNNYRLTSITFADENEDQDFDDWDDVGLNVPRPPDLFHLYRDYGKHIIPPKEMIDIGCGEDTIEEAQPEEAEADIAMAFDQEHLQMEAEIEKLQETVKEANEEKEALIKEMEALKVEFEKLKMEAASAPASSDFIPRKDSGGDSFEEPTVNGHAEEGEAEMNQINQRSERVKGETEETEDVDGIDETDVGRTESGDEGERSEDKETPGTFIKKRKHSPAFHQALLETIMPSRTSGETRLVDEVSHMSNSVDSVVEMLARCLPHITPNVLLAKREELVPLILSTGTLHPDPKERDNLLNLLFNLIKKPDEEQRQVILNGCVAFAKHAGESRAETELLPQCWEQITHKFPERRLLVAQSCGALASYLPPTIVGSLVLSMLQQLLEDKVEEVKIAAVKSLGMVFSLIEDADKYNQGLDLLLKTLHNSSEAVSAAAREVFLPAFASWAHELNRLETSLVTALVKRLELAAMDLQRTTGDSHENESMVELYCTSLQCLIPKLYVSILETAPFTDAALSSEQVEELEATRFPPTQSSHLLDVHTIVGYESKLARLVRAFESYVSQTEWQSWESFTWFTNEFIPRLIEVLGRLEASKAEVTKKLCKLFQFITRTFGPQITDAKIKPKFKAVLTIPHDQVVSMAKSGHCPITKATLPVYTCGVLVSHDSPKNRSELSSFLQESLTLLALSGAATDSIEMAFSELHSSTGFHELLLGTLWTCVVHTDPLVRVLTAKLFELLSVGLSEGLVSSRVVPALITLSGDSSVPVRVATISAFGTILERTPSKEVVERVFTQFQSFLDDPLNKDELIIIKKTILTMGQVGPASEPKFRDEFILPRLTAIAYGNCNVVEEWKKREVAMALFEAYSALSCCFISAELIQSAMLPGLRCLKRDLDLLSPEHAGDVRTVFFSVCGHLMELSICKQLQAVVGSMMRDLESKVYGRERVPSVGATSPPSATPGGQASVTTDSGGSSLKNKLGAQRSRVTGVFARKK